MNLVQLQGPGFSCIIIHGGTMRTFIIIMIFITTGIPIYLHIYAPEPETPINYDMACEYIVPDLVRCENIEAICYFIAVFEPPKWDCIKKE